MSSYFSHSKKLIEAKINHLSEDEITEFLTLLNGKLLALDELMERCEVEKLKDNIGKVRSIKEDIGIIMSDKAFCHLFGGGIGVVGTICLFSMTNPFALVLLGVSTAVGLGLGAASSSLSEKIRRKLAVINNVIEKDQRRFREVAPSIRDLDNVMRKYLGESLFKEKTNQFLISAATHVFQKCGSSAASENKMRKLLNNLVIADSFVKLYGVITGTLVVTTNAALLPILNVGLQIVSFIETVEGRDNLMENLSEDIDKLQTAYEALNIVY